MSCVPKFDDYFNKLNIGRVKKIIVPAKSMRQLSNCLHFYQHSETRNTKGLYLSCKKSRTERMELTSLPFSLKAIVVGLNKSNLKGECDENQN